MVKEVAGKLVWFVLGVCLGSSFSMYWASHQVRLNQVSNEVNVLESLRVYEALFKKPQQMVVCEQVRGPQGQPLFACSITEVQPVDQSVQNEFRMPNGQ